MNLYIVETVYHLFLALVIVNEEKNNTLIVDSHRIQTLNAVKKLEFIISIKFNKIIFVHKYSQRSTFRNKNILRHILYYLRMTCDINRVLQETKTNEFKDLYLFTTNRIERLLINKIYKMNKNNNIFLIEEGLGSYTNIAHILGNDAHFFNDVNKITNLLRKLSSTSINVSQFKELYFIFPDLVDFSIISSFKNIRLITQNNSISQIKLLVSKQYHKELATKTNTNKSIYLYSNQNDEFENNFYYNYLFKYPIDYKLHPSRMENYNKDLLINISIELLSIVDPFKMLISYASGTAITLLSLEPKFSTKFIFLFEIYHSNNIRFASDEELNFFYRLKQKFPGKIFIPKDSIELSILLQRLHSSI